MPGFDGRGPRGMGPMTGWGRGFCGSPTGACGAGPGYGRGGFGRGFRRGGFGGFGADRGFGRRAAPYDVRWGRGPAAGSHGGSPEDEAGYLKQEAEAVRRELEAIQQRIEELESRKTSS